MKSRIMGRRLPSWQSKRCTSGFNTVASGQTTTTMDREPLPELHAVSWRLDVPIASRTASTTTDATPTVELQLQLATSTAGRTHGDHATVEAADGTEPAATVLTEQWVSLDYEALVKLSQAVDAAVAALDESGYRRIQRLVK
jgi:hypothetical protein